MHCVYSRKTLVSIERRHCETLFDYILYILNGKCNTNCERVVRIVRRRRNEKKKCTGVRPNMGGVYTFFCTLSYRTQYVCSLRTDLLRVGRIRRSIVAGIYYTLLHESSASPLSVLCTLQLQLQLRSRCLYFLHGII